VLAGGAFALVQSFVAPALGLIQRELGTTTTGAGWIFTAYLLSATVFTPIAGRLGDMFGKRRLLVASLVALAAGSLLAALADSLAVMLVARVVQGAGGGIFPLGFGIIRERFPRERVANGIALLSSSLGIGGALGITLAGTVVDHLSYHWLFWIPFFVSVAAAAGAAAFVPESESRSRGQVDWLGALLLSAWLVCALLVASEGFAWGWTDPATAAVALAGVAGFALWMASAGAAAEPLVDLRMMRLRGVWTANATAGLLGFGMFSSFITVPWLVQQPLESGYGFASSITEAGLFVVPAPLAMLVVGPLAGRLAASGGARRPLLLGSAVSAVAFLVLAGSHSAPWHVYVATALMGVGMGLAYASMANLVLESVPDAQTGVASGMNMILRTIGGAVGTAVSASIVGAYVDAAGIPAERGFALTFLVCGVAALGAVAAAALAPIGLQERATRAALAEETG
jgi:EmrB/QacA subfamily drug resistance transporter